MLRKMYSIIQKGLQGYLKLLKHDGYVFMFHQVNNKTVEKNEKAFWISIDSFAKLLDNLKGKYEISTIDDIKSNKNNKSKVIITFDDAYEDCYLYAYPILKEKKIPFTVFITEEYINKPGYLNTEMIRIMGKDSLCTIGNHMQHHIFARNISLDELENEIIKNRIQLEDICGKDVKFFAFPYGSNYAVPINRIRKAKQLCELVFMTWNAPYNFKWIEKKKVVPRININEENVRRYTDV